MTWTAEQTMVAHATTRTYGHHSTKVLAGKRGTDWMLVRVTLPAGRFEFGVSAGGRIHTPAFTRHMFPREVGRG